MKSRKARLHVAHVAIAIHVLAIDVRDDGKNRRELQKRAVALVGLGDKVLRLAKASVRSHGVDSSADDTVGSSPPAASTAATIDVVVVLPCIPAMAMPYFRRINSASISARWMTGIWSLRASAISGLSVAIAELVDNHIGAGDVLGAMSFEMIAPRLARRCGDGELLRSEPETLYPRFSSTSAMPLMPMPPMPTK